MDQTRVGRGSWKDVADHIRLGIREGKYSEGEKLPSEAEMMRAHGASKMTIHRALRELSAEGIVRRVERVGSFVLPQGSRATRKIGLVLPTTEGFLEFNLLAGVREALDANEQYVLYATENDPVTEANALSRVSKEVDGILILPTCHPKTSRQLQQLSDEGFPVVCVDRGCVGFDIPAVTTNNYRAAHDALSLLLAEKRHRVGFFGIYDEAVSAIADRYQAYAELCTDDLHDPTEFVRFIPPHLGVHAKVSFRLLEDSLVRLLTREDPMTLAFCVNEYYLEAIVQVCNDLPREMWAHLDILAFNDWPRLRYQDFRVHTIRQDARGVGHKAADLLHRLFNGEKIDPLRHEVAATFFHADTPHERRHFPVSNAMRSEKK